MEDITSGAGCRGPGPDSSSGVSTPQSRTHQVRLDAGTGGREGLCQPGGPGPHPAQPHSRGVWGHSSQCPAGWPGGERPGNVALSFKKEQPLGMGQASTPAAWGTTGLTQAELGGERGSALETSQAGQRGGTYPARTLLRLRTRIRETPSTSARPPPPGQGLTPHSGSAQRPAAGPLGVPPTPYRPRPQQANTKRTRNTAPAKGMVSGWFRPVLALPDSPTAPHFPGRGQWPQRAPNLSSPPRWGMTPPLHPWLELGPVSVLPTPNTSLPRHPHWGLPRWDPPLSRWETDEPSPTHLLRGPFKSLSSRVYWGTTLSARCGHGPS